MRNDTNRMNLKKSLNKGFSIALLYGLSLPIAGALTYEIPSHGNIVGEYQKIRANSGDTLINLAEEYDIGVFEMIRANPQLNNKILKEGTPVIIPSQFVLPSGWKNGIVVNVADMRAFYFHSDGNRVSTYPVGIGRQGWSTPLGSTKIVEKEKDPDWHPPASIRQEAARNGKILPRVVLPGPHNPLGLYALHLGFRGILMHGTNKPSSVGLRSSHGCIRMYAEDIQELFSMVSVGTPVYLISQPHHYE